jgi:thiosulfate dehydrogenase [quinone] large subunit
MTDPVGAGGVTTASALGWIRSSPGRFTAGLVFSAVRVALGVLWLHEGWFKYKAHFGSSDILLVVSSADGNSRVDPLFRAFVDFALRGWPGFFGFVVPLMESALGVALILGVFTLPAAAVSLLNLMNYWSADQLIAQYPIIGVLSVAVLAFSGYATLFSATSLTVFLARSNNPGSRIGRLAAWPGEGHWRRWL